MNQRESNLPLLIGLVVALTLHGLAAATWAMWDLVSSIRFMRVDPAYRQPEPPPEEEEPLKPGQLTPGVSQVNLVTYEDYQKLLAREAQFDQPLTQTQEDPDPNARQAPLDPTPPGLRRNTAQPAPPRRLIVQAPRPDEPRTESARPRNADTFDAPPSSVAELAAVEQEVIEPDTEPGELTEPDITAEPTPPQPQRVAVAEPRPAAPEPSEADPTVAPKTDSESPAVSRIEGLEIQPGAVYSVQGVKLTTVVPRFSLVAKRTTAPRNPIVRLTFDAGGKVIRADVLRSSGYDNVDGPILNSLYKWTAEGPIDEMFVLDELKIILGVIDD